MRISQVRSATGVAGCAMDACHDPFGQPRAQVALSPDGRTVALNECHTSCRLWILDLVTGRSRQLSEEELPGGDLGKIVGDRILPDAPSPILAQASDGATVLVRATSVTDVATGNSRVVPVAAEREIVEWFVPSRWLGVELPPGWSMAIENFPRRPDDLQACDGQFVVMNLDSGELVPIEALGDPPFCG